MCNPMLIMAGVSVLSAVAGGQAKKQQAKYEAAEMEYQAAAGAEAAKAEAEQIRKAGTAARSRSRAQLAASGVDVNAGTGGMIQDDISAGFTNDAFVSLLNGSRRGDQLRRSAAFTRMGGEASQDASVINAFGSGMQAYSGWRTKG